MINTLRKTQIACMATLTLAGCAAEGDAVTQTQRIHDEFSTYMIEKYGMVAWSNTGYLPGGGLLDPSYDQYYLVVSGPDGENYQVDIKKYKSEKPVRYEDDYFGITIIDDYRKLAEPAIVKYFGRTNFYTDPVRYASNDQSLGKDSDFDDWFASDREGLFYIFVSSASMDQASFDMTCADFLTEWKTIDAKVIPHIYYIDAEAYPHMTRENYGNFLTYSYIEQYGSDLEPAVTAVPEPLTDREVRIIEALGLPDREYMSDEQKREFRETDEMLIDLEKKYGEEFICIKYEPYGSYAIDWTVYPLGGNPETDRFSVHYFSSSGRYSDDFRKTDGTAPAASVSGI